MAPLLDVDQAVRHLKAAGIDPKRAHLRCIHWSGTPARDLPPGRWKWAEVERLQQQGFRVYLIAGSGRKDEFVESIPAMPAEWDGFLLEDVLAFLHEAQVRGLPEPHLILQTWQHGSPHVWWRLREPCTDIPRWKRLMDRLVVALGSDPVCTNPSRLMRLAGSSYIATASKPAGKTGGQVLGQAEILHEDDDPEAGTTLEEFEQWVEGEYKLRPELEEIYRQTKALAQRGEAGFLPPADEDRRTSKGKAFPPRSLEEIHRKLAAIPRRVSGRKDQYSHPYHRLVLVGLRDALYRLETGSQEERIAAANRKAVELMEEHSPSRECSWSIRQQLQSSYWLNEGCFWKAETPEAVELPSPSTAAADPTDVLEVVETEATPANGKAKGKEKPKAKEKKTPDGPYRLRVDEVRDQLPNRIGRIRLNLRTGHVEANGEELAGDRLSHLYLRLSSRAETWGREVTTDAASYHANRDAYDPVQEWLEGNTAEPLPMEQWEALEEHLLGITDPLGGTILRRFLIGAVARVLEPGCWWRCAPVLVGGQNKGKTELIRALAGDWFLSGLGKLDRDATQRLRRAWLVEMGELDGITRRSDQEHLKAFLTERVDTYRSPYARAEDSHPRRCVFIGTANGSPLRDSTGSTRFAVIATGDSPLPVAWVKEHRAAIWARALEQYRAGVSWSHTEEEQEEIAKRNVNHTVHDPWREALEIEVGPLAKLGLPVRFEEIYEWLEIPVDRRNNATAERIGRVMQELGWERTQRRHNGKPLRAWWPIAGRHTRHTRVTPAPVTANPLQEKASDPLSHPYHQFPEELDSGEEQGGQGSLHLRQEQNAPENPPDGRSERYGCDAPPKPIALEGISCHTPGCDAGVTGVTAGEFWRQAGPVQQAEDGRRVPLVEEGTGFTALPLVTPEALGVFGLTLADVDPGDDDLFELREVA